MLLHYRADTNLMNSMIFFSEMNHFFVLFLDRTRRVAYKIGHEGQFGVKSCFWVMVSTSLVICFSIREFHFSFVDCPRCQVGRHEVAGSGFHRRGLDGFRLHGESG